MDLNDARKLDRDEQRSLPTDTKIALVKESWLELSTEDKERVVFMTALSVVAGAADLPVVFAIMELAEEDGLDVPPWRELKAEYDEEQEMIKALEALLRDL